MKAVYEATYAIEELGVEVGDRIVVRPAHPTAPMLVIKHHDRNVLPAILDHLDHLLPVSFQNQAPPPPRQIRRRLREHPQYPRPRLVK